MCKQTWVIFMVVNYSHALSILYCNGGVSDTAHHLGEAVSVRDSLLLPVGRVTVQMLCIVFDS